MVPSHSEVIGDTSLKADTNLSMITTALVVVSVASLITMIGLNQLDNLVHGVLYDFGLRFSQAWAMPLWISSGVIVGLSWFNIAASISLVVYLFSRRKDRGHFGTQAAATVRNDTGQRELRHYLGSQEMKGTANVEERITKPEQELIEGDVKGSAELVETQIIRYDVRHPKEIVDSQC
ncbi:MAG: hypothetical protein JSV64_04285 [Candidatus Bathyarchaeota archaeon]|nr:MAG: hypothetical protein JSV64_04285 [Candidatus Bathyarchaeota archaeon]